MIQQLSFLFLFRHDTQTLMKVGKIFKNKMVLIDEFTLKSVDV